MSARNMLGYWLFLTIVLIDTPNFRFNGIHNTRDCSVTVTILIKRLKKECASRRHSLHFKRIAFTIYGVLHSSKCQPYFNYCLENTVQLFVLFNWILRHNFCSTSNPHLKFASYFVQNKFGAHTIFTRNSKLRILIHCFLFVTNFIVNLLWLCVCFAMYQMIIKVKIGKTTMRSIVNIAIIAKFVNTKRAFVISLHLNS